MARRKKLTSVSRPKPAKPTDARVRGTLAMFVDIMGASEVSNHKTPAEYADFVNSFQDLFKSVCEKYARAWHEDHQDHMQYSARGDEGLLMIYRPRDSANIAEDVDLAINVALELKRRWLCCPVNVVRIDDELLPVGLGIGIHVGKTLIRKAKPADGNPGGEQPEGYAINLAKRVEGYSRNGRFTHIFLSEAAHGFLNQLADEMTYLFDDPETMTPKGISGKIRVYEIKHHFLPIDWIDQSRQVSRSRSLLDPPKAVEVERVQQALTINPTNLWLAEEFIRSSMLLRYYQLSAADQENADALRRAFAPARQQAESLRQSHQRDAGVLFIEGLIESEGSEYELERSNYDDAIEFSDQIAQAFWYRGLSWSYQVFEETGEDLGIVYEDLDSRHKEYVDQAIADLKEAKRRLPGCAWTRFDYACELIRWLGEPDLTEGIDNLHRAVELLETVREHARKQGYLEKAWSEDSRIQEVLGEYISDD